MRKYVVWGLAKQGTDDWGQEPFGEFDTREGAEAYMAQLVGQGHRTKDLEVVEAEWAVPSGQLTLDLPF